MTYDLDIGNYCTVPSGRGKADLGTAGGQQQASTEE